MMAESVDTTNRAVSASAKDYVDLFRPTQWVKNVVVFAGPAASLQLFSFEPFMKAAFAFVAFCFAASATYAINDIVDRRADASHPTKKYRPIARGAIKPISAAIMAIALFAGSLIISVVCVNRAVMTVIVLYILLTMSYSLFLKNRIILDVIIIALGFVLRAWAGTLSVEVSASSWLVACVFTLCMFMGFGKRRCEIAMFDNTQDAHEHRKTLVRYTPDLLNHLITVSAGIAVITFLLYTLDTGSHPAPFHKEHLFYTLPIVIYGIFRFAMLTEIGKFSGPTAIVLKDKAMIGAIILWALCALVIAYQVPLFGPDGLEGIVHRIQ